MVLENQHTIAKEITNLKRELAALDAQRDVLKNKIAQLQNSLTTDTEIADPTVAYSIHQVTGEFSETEKIALFRSLFRGREDEFPKRFESKRTGKSGYLPGTWSIRNTRLFLELSHSVLQSILSHSTIVHPFCY